MSCSWNRQASPNPPSADWPSLAPVDASVARSRSHTPREVQLARAPPPGSTDRGKPPPRPSPFPATAIPAQRTSPGTDTRGGRCGPRAAREAADLSLAEMARRVPYGKAALGFFETDARTSASMSSPPLSIAGSTPNKPWRSVAVRTINFGVRTPTSRWVRRCRTTGTRDCAKVSASTTWSPVGRTGWPAHWSARVLPTTRPVRSPHISTPVRTTSSYRSSRTHRRPIRHGPTTSPTRREVVGGP